MLADDARAWIADVDGRPVAFSMAKSAERTVFAIFVRPGYEGRGLGRALMNRAEAWLFASGADEIWLTTGSDLAARPGRTPRARRCTCRFGFRQVGLFPRIGWKFGAWHDVIFWQLDLAAAVTAPTPFAPFDETVHLR
jgi:L-amino acid N-acyltransferase YncA